MARIESRVLVPQSVADVFAFLNRPESHRNFIPRMVALQQVSPGAFGQAGTRLTGTLRYFGLLIPVEYEILQVEPNQSLAMKGKMGPVRFTDGYVLREDSAGTEIRFWLDLVPRGWARIFSPVAGLVGKLHAWETLRNLRRALGAATAASSSRQPEGQHGDRPS